MDLKFQIDKRDDFDVVVFNGPINENLGNLDAELGEKVGKKVIFHLKGIDYINSIGIRCWLEFLRGFQDGRQLIYEECAPDLISQINMIPQMGGSAEIVTFYGNLVCPECDHEQLAKFEAKTGYEPLVAGADKIKCEKCGEASELEEDPEVFFNFLKQDA